MEEEEEEEEEERSGEDGLWNCFRSTLPRRNSLSETRGP